MLEPQMGHEDPADGGGGGGGGGGDNEERGLTVVGGLDAQLDRKVQSETPSAFLLVSKGDYPGRVYPIARNTVTIGRDVGCDIRLFDAPGKDERATAEEEVVGAGHGGCVPL